MPDSPPPEKRSLPRRLLNRLEVDRAVFYAIVARGWQFVAGPVTIFLIALYFREEVQGYYYAFWGVVALQMFFELGFTQTIINFSSHEWSKLETDDATLSQASADDYSRLSSLLRASLVSYLLCAILSTIVILIAGWIMFSRDEYSAVVDWQGPWIALSLLSMVVFGASPTLMILEGCNQVKAVYKMQFVRAVIGNIVVWLAILLGAELWTPVLATIAKLICEGYLICVVYRKLFSKLLQKPIGPIISWRNEVWPFHWRIAVRSLFGYFNAMIMNPIVFIYQDSVAAGQLGMVWQVLSAAQSACASWVRTRAAQLGMLVAKQDYKELDRVFYRVSKIALWILAGTFLAFCLFNWLLYWWPSQYATRLLPPEATLALALGVIATTVMEFQWVYIYAHQRAPYFAIGIACAVISGLMIWWWGMWYGAIGVCLAFMTVNLIINLPLFSLLFKRFRRDYHDSFPNSNS